MISCFLFTMLDGVSLRMPNKTITTNRLTDSQICFTNLTNSTDVVSSYIDVYPVDKWEEDLDGGLQVPSPEERCRSGAP